MLDFASVLLTPAVRLMRRLRLPVKLGLLGTILMLPLVLLAISQVRMLNAERSVAFSERDGAQMVSAWLDVARELQVHRALTARVLSSDKDAVAEREKTRQQLRAELADVQQLVERGLAFALPAQWTAARDAALALAEGKHGTRRDDAFNDHSKAIDATRRLIFLIAENSQLLLDPVAETWFLMDLSVNQLLPFTEAMSAARGHGAGLLARGDANTRERTMMLTTADSIAKSADEIATRLGALERAGTAMPASWTQARASANKYGKLTRDTFGSEAITGEPAPYYAEGGAAVTASSALANEINNRLVQQLEKRATEAQFALWWQLSLVLLMVSMVCYLGLAFYSSFYGSLSTLHAGVDKVARGDLSHKIVIDGRDEMSEIGTLVEDMNQRLSAMVAEIRSSAVRVGMAGRVVADGSESLAQRTDEQASSLRQTLASAQSLSTAVAANAAAAGELDRLTGRLRQDAEAGGGAMRETVQAMSQLETSSKRVGEIISVIDGIAFQTNILALNAAVEAARAGESGRGFAVVATEVRTLAQRSSSAAGEIRALISQSGQQVQASVSRIQNVGQVLDSLVKGVRTASDSLRTIAAASAQQSSELEQVADSVGSLDGITRENASMVAQSAAASQDLVNRAARLTEAVASIRLRQGSADEAKSLVDRAYPLLKRQGLQGASVELHSRDNGFVDRDLYIFVIDRNGTYRLHGAKPAMEGKRVHEVPGIDGDRFVRDAWAAVAAGGGWIDYDIINGETGKVMPKASYVVGLDKELFIGCGVYRHEDSTAAAPAVVSPAPMPKATAAAAPKKPRLQPA